MKTKIEYNYSFGTLWVELKTEDGDSYIYFRISSNNTIKNIKCLDKEIPNFRTEILRAIDEERKKYAPHHIFQPLLSKLKEAIEEYLITHEEEQRRKEEEQKRKKEEEERWKKEERLRKESNLAEWRKDLERYLQVLQAEVQRVSELLQKNFILDNYDEIKEGYFQKRLEYPSDDDC
jgi:signal recognition particle GTPase